MSTCRTGDRINNYLLQEMLGMGSFGEVWLAKHHIFDELVAIKVPTDPQYVRYLQHEGAAIHGLRHENIVRALDLDPFTDPPYFIMEYIDGPTLREMIDAHRQGLPQQVVINVFQGMLTALVVAHQADIVHRDIKPANVLLNIGKQMITTVEPKNVKVTDFGLGKIGGLTTASIMQSGSAHTEQGKNLSGTIAYMSPEQRDGHTVDHRSDLYSCGIVLFEMLTGERPQGSDVPSQIRSGIEPFLNDVFTKCYTHLDRRYQHADEILRDLGELSGELTVTTSNHLDRKGAKPSCPQCDGIISTEDQFCIYCGKQLADIVPRCPGCEAYTYKADKYCIVCGADLRVKN